MKNSSVYYKNKLTKGGKVMQINQFIVICLILVAMVAVTIFMLHIASNLLEWIMSIATIIFTVIFTIIVNTVLFIASVVIGLISCVVFIIGGLIVYLKKKFRKGKDYIEVRVKQKWKEQDKNKRTRTKGQEQNQN